MIVAVPKEIKDHEYRVSLTPDAARAVISGGHRVLVEKGAGAGSGFADEEYRRAGTKIVESRDRLFDEGELILKVKEPLPAEFPLLHKGQILFTFLHLAANRPLTEALLDREVTALAYETIQLSNGTLPVLRPMSEIAGRMSVLVGAFYLQKVHGGSGVLLPGVQGVSSARVVVLGAGSVGQNAARMAVGLGAQLTLFHRETDDVKSILERFNGKLAARLLDPELIDQAVQSADLVVGAVLVTGAKAPKLVSRALVSRMRKGSVIVDVSIDQGGCVETARPTSHSNPIYVEEGVIHYCVTNMPGAFPRTGTQALSSVTLPYLLKLAKEGLEGACRRDSALAKGLNTHGGRLTHGGVAEAHGMAFTPASDLL